MRFLILILPILCFLCYMPAGGKNIILMMPGLMVIYMSLWVHSSLSITAGRRQRFWSALALAATVTILITLAVTLLAIITQLLEMVMPPLTVKGHEFTFSALNINYSVMPILMIPLMYTIALIFHKKPILTMFFAMIVFQVFFITSIVSNLKIRNYPVHITPMHIAIMLPLVWAIFITTLRRISMKACLTN